MGEWKKSEGKEGHQENGKNRKVEKVKKGGSSSEF